MKREMHCPHKAKVSDCPDCSGVLNEVMPKDTPNTEQTDELMSTLWHILETGEMPTSELRAVSLSADKAKRVQTLRCFIESREKQAAERAELAGRLESYQQGLLAGSIPESVGKPMAEAYIKDLKDRLAELQKEK